MSGCRNSRGNLHVRVGKSWQVRPPVVPLLLLVLTCHKESASFGFVVFANAFFIYEMSSLNFMHFASITWREAASSSGLPFFFDTCSMFFMENNPLETCGNTQFVEKLRRIYVIFLILAIWILGFSSSFEILFLFSVINQFCTNFEKFFFIILLCF